MKQYKKAIIFVLALISLGIGRVSAITIDDCDLVGSYKESSYDDETLYICSNKKDQQFNVDKNTIYLNNSNIYYLHIYKENITLNISGNNSISLLNIDSVIEVKGNGSLKFKEANLIKKNLNGNLAYQFVYKNKRVKLKGIIYENTIDNFILDYDTLKEENDLPDEYLEEDYYLLNAYDYEKINPITISSSWLDKNIITNLVTRVEDGNGIVEYIEDNKTLENDNIVLVSDSDVKNYSLEINDLSTSETALEVNKTIDDKELVNLYDVSVYKGKKEVPMKNGSYTIKIKLDDIDKYSDYQVIYIDDDGEILEYFDPVIEGEYLIFNTSHLSQYGVIASTKVEETFKEVTKKNRVTRKELFIILYIFIIPSYIVIELINFIYKKKIKKTKRIKRV